MTLNCNLHFNCADQTLPKKSGTYLCLMYGGKTWLALPWSNKWQRFNADDWDTDCDKAIKVDWWTDMPKWTAC